jgi:hypothetical protein
LSCSFEFLFVIEAFAEPCPTAFRLWKSKDFSELAAHFNLRTLAGRIRRNQIHVQILLL